MARFFQDWKDGRGKLAAMVALLAFRAENPQIFTEGAYEGLTVEGGGADQVCAFLRTFGGTTLVVAVARFPRRLEDHGLAADTRVRNRSRRTAAASGATCSPAAPSSPRRRTCCRPPRCSPTCRRRC